jgi:RNA polymerase sigma-70 factor (ECF subfamily)
VGGVQLLNFLRLNRAGGTLGRAPEDVTLLLNQLGDGDQNAATQLVPLVYKELRRMAAQCLRQERPGHTLQATALVHEAYIKLAGQRDAKWQNRAQFFAVASQLMRRILVDYARAQLRSKRGGKQQRVSLDDSLLVSSDRTDELLAVNECLARLEAMDARQGRIVELRYFGGLSVDETAEVLRISSKTVLREWNVAKAWLYGTLKESYADDSGKLEPGKSTV